MADSKPDMRRVADVTLDFPIEVDGQTITTITMRRPKVKDSLKAENFRGSDFERGLLLMADLCTAGSAPMAPEHLHELDEADAAKLQTQLESFRGGGI